MNNELQLFDFENNQIRVLKINNEPWFVGKDLAKKLYNNGDWLSLEGYYGLSCSY